MTNIYITIKESSEICGKSVQTIRRMIKAKKIKFRKDKTPQGFNYLVDKISLCEYFGIELAEGIQETETQEATEVIQDEVEAVEVTAINTPKEEVVEASTETNIVTNDRQQQKIVNYEPVREFNDTLQQLIAQHGKEKDNLFKLIESFQNKVINLETKLKDNKSRKSWLKLW